MLGCLPVTSNARARQERAATRAQALVLRKVRQGQGERDFTSVKGRVRPLLVPLALVVIAQACGRVSDGPAAPNDNLHEGGAGGVTTTSGRSGSASGAPGTGGLSSSGGRAEVLGAGGDHGGASGSPDAGGAGGEGITPAVEVNGPCDLYAEAGTPCVAAYSTVRRLRRDYAGPLYQVRSDSNPMNTGSGGQLHDVGSSAAGFADAQAQDALCAATVCTVARVYDQSGHGNDLLVAPAGLQVGGEFAAKDDFESIANAGPLTVGGHPVYSLFMEKRQGYRSPNDGRAIPRGADEQGIYMLADGTRSGSACCWDFGNAAAEPNTFHDEIALFLGTGYWGSGAGVGPWFMVSNTSGVWAGGSKAGDPGWGALDAVAPPNLDNPSMAVPFALGFLKTGAKYAIRMADVEHAETLSTAYDGPLFKRISLAGAVILGIGSANENNSFGTFYEGAVLAGYPSDEVEQAVLRNVQAAGYGKDL